MAKKTNPSTKRVPSGKSVKTEKKAKNIKKISILGAGLSGRALARLACRHDYEVFVSEAGILSPEIRDFFTSMRVAWEEGGNTERLEDADLLVVSSGVHPDVPALRSAREKGVPVSGELDFVLPYLHGTLIGVTGSNGKTTTTSLIGHLLKSAGVDAAVAGNIGEPLADFADRKWDAIVVELSSFQLHWTDMLSVDYAVVTNLAPDHIDWHGSYEAYVRSKVKLAERVKPSGAAVVQLSELGHYANCPGTLYPLAWLDTQMTQQAAVSLDEHGKRCTLLTPEGTKELFTFDQLRLLGRHNLENVAMAMTIASLYGPFEPARLSEALISFDAPAHRCEYVDTVDDVRFVNDSKGTNVAAAVTALSSLEGTKVVILGGQGKGESYSQLADAVKRYAAWAVLLGAEREKIAAALEEAGFDHIVFVGDMGEAVRTAFGKATSGQTVLLSPACTSWDMYANYKKRGEDFVSAVASLQKERSAKGRKKSKKAVPNGTPKS